LLNPLNPLVCSCVGAAADSAGAVTLFLVAVVHMVLPLLLVMLLLARTSGFCHVFNVFKTFHVPVAILYCWVQQFLTIT